MRHWYLVHTKPRQEMVARDNLERQGYPCFLPLLPVQRRHGGRLVTAWQPLFSRYLFIGLDDDLQGRSWAPVRSTLGVARLVSFGNTPARVPPALLEHLRQQAQALASEPVQLFTPGQAVALTDGPFAGLEGLYQMADGDARAIVLLTFMHKAVPLAVELNNLRIV